MTQDTKVDEQRPVRQGDRPGLWSEQQREQLGPPPGDDPVERLRHTLAAYEGSDGWAIQATSNIYNEAPVTGLTWADLRSLAALFDPSPVLPAKSKEKE